MKCRPVSRVLMMLIMVAVFAVVHAPSDSLAGSPASAVLPASPASIDERTVWTLVSAFDVEGLRRMGPEVLPVLARLYESSNGEETILSDHAVSPALARLQESPGVKRRTTIAEIFYQLGWKSPEAKQVLMRDVHTKEGGLRLQVQWALGRVSNDDDVVAVLLDNMQHDTNPLFRDKAACALASDQVHLTPEQKVKLYDGLIHALSDDKVQVREIAIKALEIQTGQRKGFKPDAPVQDRIQIISVWHRWLEEYKSNL